MIILIDTDILVDLALDRKPYAEPAGRLLDVLQTRPGTAYVAWHTLSNFSYLVVPTRGRDTSKAFLTDLVRFSEAKTIKPLTIPRPISPPKSDSPLTAR